jgi:3-phosphoshikimate 1-carboxyvinyltransferase
LDTLDLPRVTRAAGRLRLPGSKSISNRTLLLSALARGATTLDGLLDSDDTRVMREALGLLGVRIDELGAPERVRVQGLAAPGAFPVKSADIFLGNSGTSARSLTGVLALADGHYRLSGVPRMHERPIGDLVEALRPAGARIEWLGKAGFPPLAISPRERVPLPTIRIRGNVSSQFVSGVLMALPWTGEAARVEIEGELISRPYVDLTLGLMERFGVTVRRDGDHAFDLPAGRVCVAGRGRRRGATRRRLRISWPPARSAAVRCAWRASDAGAARRRALHPRARRDGRQGRVRRQLDRVPRDGPPLDPFDLDMNLIPDAAMTGAVLALFAKGPCVLRNIASWRVKETDRIAAMATELRKFGAEVEEGATSCASSARRISCHLPPAACPCLDRHLRRPPHGDELLARVVRPAPVRINDPDCVSKTFPATSTRSRAGSVTTRAGDVPRNRDRRPSASGKGTVAPEVAEALGFRYLDSGALYRLVTLAALKAASTWAMPRARRARRRHGGRVRRGPREPRRQST